nr:peptide deformylase [Mycoplasmopsis pulmonis]
MFKVEIVQLPKKVLRQKSKNVNIPLNKTNIELAEKMIYHIDDSQGPNTKFRPGVGVAAVQYGILKNVFYVCVPNDSRLTQRDSSQEVKPEDKYLFRDVIFNPEVIWKSDEMVAISQGEGCLSVDESWPNQEGLVRRHMEIKVKGYSYFQKKEMIWHVKGYVAIVFQHELDHLNGMLFIDRIDPKRLWDKSGIKVL